MGLFDFFSKDKKAALDKGLEQTKESFFSKISRTIVGKSVVDEQVLDQLEEALIGSDVGAKTTIRIIKALEERVKKDKYIGTAQLHGMLAEEVAKLLGASQNHQQIAFPEGIKPYVIMVVGVNGVGKTTTIGKLATQFSQAGKKVVLGAGDTFRAAAVAQLQLWGERAGVPVVSHGMDTDPASVAYDAVKQGIETGADVVIIDTAGRLHNKKNLMEELGKIKRVMQKLLPDAPHEVLLVLDGSSGQNAIIQAQEFTKVTQITALAVTKLDGTAKGGVVISIADQFNIPIKYIGVGEQSQDLQLFDKLAFAESLFS